MSERLDKAPSNRKPVGGLRSCLPGRVQRDAEEARSAFVKSAVGVGVQVTHCDAFHFPTFSVSSGIILFFRAISDVRREISALERFGNGMHWPPTSWAL